MVTVIWSCPLGWINIENVETEQDAIDILEVNDIDVSSSHECDLDDWGPQPILIVGDNRTIIKYEENGYNYV